MSLGRLSRTAGIGMLLLVGCSPRRDADQSVTGDVITPAIARPDFVLTDTRGRPFDFRAQTSGKVTLLFFGYTHCPDVCPTHMANIAAALHELGPTVARQVEVVFVTTDSLRDTLARLRRWLDGFDSSFVGLTGNLPRVNLIQGRLRILPAAVHVAGGAGGYEVAHGAVVLAFTRDDSAHVVYPAGVQRAGWVADLKRLVELSPPARAP